MASSSSVINTICPYYVNDSGLILSCEGIVGMVTSTRFATSKQRLMQQWKYCFTHDYKNCPIAAILEKKYDG